MPIHGARPMAKTNFVVSRLEAEPTVTNIAALAAKLYYCTVVWLGSMPETSTANRRGGRTAVAKRSARSDRGDREGRPCFGGLFLYGTSTIFDQHAPVMPDEDTARLGRAYISLK